MLPPIMPNKELCSSPIDGRRGDSSQQFYHCNSLLAGVPRYQLDRLQSVMNTQARLIVGAKKQDHMKHVLRDRTERPVQAVSADIQDAAWTGTVINRRPLLTSHNRR